jgi:2,4-dichlorophenol 6-monooxygenase
MPDLNTDVLIIGSGPAGSAAALALATYGVQTTVITKYGRLADTPRAHITNQRTMEALRDLGVEEEVMAEAAPQELMGNLVYCTSIAGEELGRLHAWGTRPDRLADYTAASPSRICDMPQDLMEPVLLHNAQTRGAKVRFDTEYLSLQQDDDGVTVHVRDRLRGDEYDIRAKYVIARSPTTSACRCGGRWASAAASTSSSRPTCPTWSPTAPRSCTGCCSRAPTSAASAPAWCAWSGPGTSG